jgi:hypothetical protein
MIKKLLILLSLAISVYPVEVSARDLVGVGRSDGTTYYVWRDSIRTNGDIVWWTEESVRYGTGNNLEVHEVADLSGDCRSMAGRLRRLHNKITGKKYSKVGKLIAYPPESIGYAVLEYVCSQR